MNNTESLEQNKAVYRRFIEEVFNGGQLELIDELLAPDYVFNDAPPGTPPGKDAIRQVVTLFRSGFPDLYITIEDVLAERDLVCFRATTRGTHLGEAFGIPATGRKIEMKGLTMVRIEDGKVAESWVKNDVAGLMKQLKG
jgi:steroid delta-isomerase-like uncharacterized protein